MSQPAQALHAACLREPSFLLFWVTRCPGCALIAVQDSSDALAMRHIPVACVWCLKSDWTNGIGNVPLAVLFSLCLFVHLIT
jgi:hypothetical protein